MFEGHRRTAISAGLTLIAAFAFGGYILGHQLGQEVGKKDAHTKEYERHAADEIERTCLRLDPVAEAECVVRVMKTAHEHQRAESDLIAQRNMARWALLMLFATVAMAVITGAGVYYVWRTLGVTREIGEAQVRAYLNVSLEFRDDEWRPMAHCTVHNAGNSPAKMASLNAMVVSRRGGTASILHKQELGNIRTGTSAKAKFSIQSVMEGEEIFVLAKYTTVFNLDDTEVGYWVRERDGLRQKNISET